ncbi:MAG: RNA methyltransferase [Clostridia bacterium]|nr:RNA methyltransferase [Clostridia bacterium]
MVITSKDNEQIKHIRKLKEKKYRDEYNEYVIEGIKLIKEAIQEDANIKTIIACDNCVKDEEIDPKIMYEIAKYNCIYVEEKVFHSITDVKNPQGLLAIMSKEQKEEEIDFKEDIIVVLDNVQDPGNIGTILRTVDSIGLKQIIVSKNSGDVYNPKVVRSTMGAILRVNVIESQDLVETLKTLKKHKFEVVATSLQTDNTIYDIDYKKKVIVIGNEANGVSKEILDIADEKVKIPMLGKTESLNAAVATGIITYEYVRQKLMKKD